MIFEPSIADLTQKQTISILFRTSCMLNYDNKNIPDKIFLNLYYKFLEIELDEKMQRNHNKRIGRQNIGRLCPECESTKQAIHSGDRIVINEDTVLDAAFELENGRKRLREPDPKWTCIDCGHEWMGGMTIL